MKKQLSMIATLVISTLVVAAAAAAASPVHILLNKAYPKGNNTYDVVVKEIPGTKLALYINDKNPVYATANKKDWATFHGVKIIDSGKVSFAKVITSKKKSYQKPINYVQYFLVSGESVTFEATTPSKPTPPKAPTTAQSTPVQAATPAPQPTCTNGTYVNSAGNTVCSPEVAPSAPAGATAQCVDGTYSFSQSRSGTCSHHGGVAQWL